MPRQQDVQSRVANAATLGLVGSFFGRTGTVAGIGLGALGVGPFSKRPRGGRSPRGGSRWISGALEGSVKGRFSKKARKAGMSTQDFACHVLKRNSYDTRTRREAQMFVNMNRSRRCVRGGRIARGGGDENKYDAEIIKEARKPKLYDYGAHLKVLKELATREGLEIAKSVAVSPVAKQILSRL
jgi:hypothetical protein